MCVCLRPASIVLRAKSIRLKDLRQKVANHCGASCAPPPSAVAIWCSHKARAACRFKEVCLVPGTPRAVLSIYRQRPCSSAVTICRHAWKLPLNSIFNIDQYCSLMQFAAISTLFWFCAQRKTDGHIKKQSPMRFCQCNQFVIGNGKVWERKRDQFSVLFFMFFGFLVCYEALSEIFFAAWFLREWFLFSAWFTVAATVCPHLDLFRD